VRNTDGSQGLCSLGTASQMDSLYVSVSALAGTPTVYLLHKENESVL
jgi:hypothetical protein